MGKFSPTADMAHESEIERHPRDPSIFHRDSALANAILQKADEEALRRAIQTGG